MDGWIDELGMEKDGRRMSILRKKEEKGEGGKSMLKGGAEHNKMEIENGGGGRVKKGQGRGDWTGGGKDETGMINKNKLE